MSDPAIPDDIMRAVTVRALFEYDHARGRLIWRARPETDFPSRTACNSWNARHAGKVAGGVGKRGYAVTFFGGKNRYIHRVIWLYVYGYLPSGEIDHINGVRTDNRLQNLRDVNRAENSRNQRRRCDNKSGTLGVYWDRSHRKWRATINSGGKQKVLGVYPCLGEAVAARKAAERRYGYHPNHGRNGRAAAIRGEHQ